MIKFIFKITLVVIIAVAAVAYHNTDAGKEMERRVGRAIEYDSMADRGKSLLKRTFDFIMLKGMRSAVSEGKSKIETNGIRQGDEMAGPPQENITEEERRAVEKIIENEG